MHPGADSHVPLVELDLQELRAQGDDALDVGLAAIEELRDTLSPEGPTEQIPSK